jgi:hypothetical protein
MEWSKSKQYDTGEDPSVSMNNQKVIVETHSSPGTLFDPGIKLWYHVGKLTSDTTVDWGDSHQYDTGWEPSVAINDLGQVVQVHLTDSVNQVDLWYRVGKVNGDVVEWGDSQKYDTGGHPAVAINNNGTVVEVHDSGIGVSTPTLWYRVGQIAGDKIDWKGKAKYDDGFKPDVAIDDNGNVVEVHGVTVGFDLWYHVGTINGGLIEWGGSHRLADGVDPSIAIGKDKAVLEVYGAPTPNADEADLLYRTGVISGKEIEWDKDGEKFGEGQFISVTLSSSGDAVEVHQSENEQTLWYSVGSFAGTGTDDALYSGTKCYFFSGNQYIRVTRGDTGPGTVDPGYPAPISNWGWGSFGEKGIDAALYSGTKCYFFAGDRYIRVTLGEDGPGTIDPGYPKSIAQWDWPASFYDLWVNNAGLLRR